MKIQSSNIAMTSQRTYKVRSADLISYSSWGNGTANSALPTAKDSMKQTVTERSVSSYQNFSNEELLSNLEREQKTYENKGNTSSKTKDVFQPQNPIEFYTFRNILELLFGVKNTKKDWVSEFRQLLVKRKELALESFGMPYKTSKVTASETWGVSYYETHYFEEQESTKFYSSGKVKTEDGKEIDFDVSVFMSRDFERYSNVQINYGKAACVDPLVINIGSDTASVKEQKFLFDLDCDGKLDTISLLSEMSGYLALDKNEDGIINNGSELFGTKTGNGFEELAVFDMDGNGWIDENDPIFDKLRIWTKDANGNDKLVGIGVKGVGAIYLGNVNTQFSLNSSINNQNNAQIRSTGMYLKENGEAGTIQHIDMTVGA